MFTGIIEEVGVIHKIVTGNRSREFIIQARRILEGSGVEDSVAVNGVCLTVTAISAGTITAQAVEETLKRTTLGLIKPGTPVNLERALTLEKRIGGHLVQGHIDTTSIIRNISKEGDAFVVTLSIEPAWRKYIVEKGSVAVHGVSLTVSHAGKQEFSVAVIPYTWENTVFKNMKKGGRVNIEYDILGKYVENLLNAGKDKMGALSVEKLDSLGYIKK